ncbi:dTDP-glucose 4,6-dehydratase [Leptospira fainei serovar Hurstbridge str. BUT 6]|uniref:dTDP-glucose 4,6-dehydratase n=1 Tax=Leptospira fainei serovar Hurstbridge str. BUT 6 TaxID=1193011 RepID=S3W6Q9_9LEPT|nr:dTDP-glucose 4,6-dehydratase [Leptospira fainei]EPG75842.1 dTDP-glucose 4,6-dehydratase [Leptospira fainei serovar Hurstbridge str. BUT 6]
MKKILVTGGAGFIGSNLVGNILKNTADYEVVVLDKLSYSGNLNNLSDWFSNKRFSFKKIDISNIAEVESFFAGNDFDAIIHLAAESHVDRSIAFPGDFINTNIVGTFNLLESVKRKIIASKRKIRFLHVSTDEVFGSLSESDPSFTENSCYKPNSPYSASKAASDHLVRSYFHTYHLDVITTNCSNNFGPFQFPEKLIPVTIINCLQWKQIPVYGNGSNIRDWLYVEDHCNALRLVLEKGRIGESYNIGSRNECRNLDIVTSICEIMDRLAPQQISYKSLIHFVEDRPGHDYRYSINPDKIETELDWRPEFTFDAALEETIKWYIANDVWWKDILTGKTDNKLEFLERKDRLT